MGVVATARRHGLGIWRAHAAGRSVDGEKSHILRSVLTMSLCEPYSWLDENSTLAENIWRGTLLAFQPEG